MVALANNNSWRDNIIYRQIGSNTGQTTMYMYTDDNIIIPAPFLSPATNNNKPNGCGFELLCASSRYT